MTEKFKRRFVKDDTLAETKIKYCSKCKEESECLKCGFGKVGGICGNARYECKKCRSIIK